MNPRRLYRCRHDKQLAGVASGMAEYLGLDPTLVRILWILSVFFGGFTILLYIILAFVMPLEPIGSVANDAQGAPSGDPQGDPTGPGTGASHEHRPRREGRLGLAFGVLLVVFGSIALVGSAFPGWVAGIALGPAFLVALGLAFVAMAIRRPSAES